MAPFERCEMSAKIIIVGDMSSTLLGFALRKEFTIEICTTEEVAVELERGLIISGDRHYNEQWPVDEACKNQIGFDPRPTKQQRREWRKHGKNILR